MWSLVTATLSAAAVLSATKTAAPVQDVTACVKSYFPPNALFSIVTDRGLDEEFLKQCLALPVWQVTATPMENNGSAAPVPLQVSMVDPRCTPAQSLKAQPMKRDSRSPIAETPLSAQPSIKPAHSLISIMSQGAVIPQQACALGLAQACPEGLAQACLESKTANEESSASAMWSNGAKLQAQPLFLDLLLQEKHQRHYAMVTIYCDASATFSAKIDLDQFSTDRPRYAEGVTSESGEQQPSSSGSKKSKGLVVVKVQSGLTNQLYSVVSALMIAKKLNMAFSESSMRFLSRQTCVDFAKWAQEDHAAQLSVSPEQLIDMKVFREMCEKVKVDLSIQPVSSTLCFATANKVAWLDLDQANLDSTHIRLAEMPAAPSLPSAPSLHSAERLSSGKGGAKKSLPPLCVRNPFLAVRPGSQEDHQVMLTMLCGFVPNERLQSKADAVEQGVMRYVENTDSPGYVAVHYRCEADWNLTTSPVDILVDHICRVAKQVETTIVLLLGAVPAQVRAQIVLKCSATCLVLFKTDVVPTLEKDLGFEELAMVDRALALAPSCLAFLGCSDSSFSLAIAAQRAHIKSEANSQANSQTEQTKNFGAPSLELFEKASSSSFYDLSAISHVRRPAFLCLC